MKDEKIEQFYQIRAKEIIDLLFDKNYFREDVSRDDMQGIEDFLAWSFKTQCESAVKCAELSKRARELNENPKQ